MASQTVRPENGNGNKRTWVTEDPRVVHLEGRVERVEGDVRDIKAGVQKLLDRPQNPGFSQVVTTFLATLGCGAFLFGFAQWWLSQATGPILTELAAMKQKAEWASDSVHATNIKAAVLEERMSWVRDLAKGKTP